MENNNKDRLGMKFILYRCKERIVKIKGVRGKKIMDLYKVKLK